MSSSAQRAVLDLVAQDYDFLLGDLRVLRARADLPDGANVADSRQAKHASAVLGELDLRGLKRALAHRARELERFDRSSARVALRLANNQGAVFVARTSLARSRRRFGNGKVRRRLRGFLKMGMGLALLLQHSDAGRVVEGRDRQQHHGFW